MRKADVIKKLRSPMRRIRKRVAGKASVPVRRIRKGLARGAAVPIKGIRNIRKRLRLKTAAPLPSFIASIEEQPKVRIMHMQGDLVQDTIPAVERFRKKFIRAKGFKSKNLILDLQKVTDVDSSTLATVILQAQEMKKKRHRLGLANINAEMKSMIEIFKVKDQFLVFTSVEQAVKALG